MDGVVGRLVLGAEERAEAGEGAKPARRKEEGVRNRKHASGPLPRRYEWRPYAERILLTEPEENWEPEDALDRPLPRGLYIVGGEGVSPSERILARPTGEVAPRASA